MKRNLLNLLGTLAVISVLSLELSTALAQGTGFPLLTTFTNPMPVAADWFGISVAAVGTNRVLIGADGDDTQASDAGVAYLFGTDGALITTFTNPTPAADDHFGYPVAAFGTDRVLIGAYLDDTGATNAGVVYLFSTTGALLTTFTNPTPAAGDTFGASVAAVGTDRVLIGAPFVNRGTNAFGVAYLFRTNGTLLTTFTHPTPTTSDGFGRSVAAAGSDFVLIGSPDERVGAFNSGVVYLFHVDGTLLTAFTNPGPAPSWFFGHSVAAAGADRVLIGSPWDNTGATNAGVAYLFSTNGALLTTFTNPAPVVDGNFGYSLTAVGNDRVLIGAYWNDAGAVDAGAVYLFKTNGTLLATFTNPAPVAYEGFGVSVAAVGTDRVLIGAHYGNAGATLAGAAYLFSTAALTSETPSLSIRSVPINRVAISWPSPSTGWTLQQNTNGVASGNWSNALGPIQDDGTTKTLIVTPSVENRFYRLFKP